jgi:hypothetical protein
VFLWPSVSKTALGGCFALLTDSLLRRGEYTVGGTSSTSSTVMDMAVHAALYCHRAASLSKIGSSRIV